MDGHDDVLPRERYTNPTTEQQEEIKLRKQYNRCTDGDSANEFTAEQHRLYQGIERRKTLQSDLDTISEVREFAKLHNGKLPMQSREDLKQKALAKRFQNLRTKTMSPMLQTCLAELTATTHQTPTKAAARGAKQKHRKQAALVLQAKVEEAHKDWCVRHFPDDDPLAKPSPHLQKHHTYPGLANLGNTCYVNAVCQVGLFSIEKHQELAYASPTPFPPARHTRVKRLCVSAAKKYVVSKSCSH